jgi:hypothetical protein
MVVQQFSLDLSISHHSTIIDAQWCYTPFTASMRGDKNIFFYINTCKTASPIMAPSDHRGPLFLTNSIFSTCMS